MNNSTPGAIKAKQGDNACVLSRSEGYRKTEAAMGSKTRSRHKGTDLHNKWGPVPGDGMGGNVKGYSDHGSKHSY
jgi:hypothetical protein